MRQPRLKKAAARKAASVKKPARSPVGFRFLGFQDGWYALSHPADHEIENEVFDWLIAQQIVIGKSVWLGNGSVYPDRPKFPVPADGSQLCILFKRPVDVLRFEMRFPCLGITPDTMLDALRAEATNPRLTIRDLARIVYDAMHRFYVITGTDHKEWDALFPDDKDGFIEEVRLQIEAPEHHEQITTLAKVRHDLFVSTVASLIPLLEPA